MIPAETLSRSIDEQVVANLEPCGVPNGDSSPEPEDPFTKPENRLLLRGGEVASLLGISRAQAFRWMSRGVLPVVRMPGSRTVRVPKAALLRFIEERTREGCARRAPGTEARAHGD